jgi:Ras homolog gene family, member A
LVFSGMAPPDGSNSPQVYVPTLFENYVLDMDLRGKPIELALWDTAAQGDYEDRLRPLSYPEAHAFLICFSIDRTDSLENVLEKWDPEVKYFGAGQVPRFLVGCKKDLRHDPETLASLARYSQVPVTAEQGKEIATAIGAEYFECSSKTGEGVRELFARVTESMKADKVVRFKHKGSHRSWYRNGGCIVV